MKHDGIQLYIVMMWIESQGKFNIVIVWDETWGNSIIYSNDGVDGITREGYYVEEITRKCNIVILWDETFGNSIIHCYDVE